MDRLFGDAGLGTAELKNRFFFPPIKLGYGNPDGTVADRQLNFYQQIARQGPAVVILEPVSVSPEGREHPRQPFIHLPESAAELRKIVDVIHREDRLACLHLNHAGAAANPKATQTSPKAPSVFTCAASGNKAEALDDEEIKSIIAAYRSAAIKALEAGFDLIEVQAGHGYLISQFLNAKINERNDAYGQDRLLFAAQVLSAVKEGASNIPVIVRVSGNEMSPDYGVAPDDLNSFLKMAEDHGAVGVHVGMGSACFSPPWYFHHASLPEKPQLDALTRIREHTSLPIIAAGRLGRKERIESILNDGLADFIAVGRPLIADPDLIEKWKNKKEDQATLCGYCLQGCLHRVKNGKPLGCNLNPEIGLPPLKPSGRPLRVLVAGGGPAGMSAALFLTRRGHRTALVEAKDNLGGQFSLAWRAPGKEKMKDGLDSLERSLRTSNAEIIMGKLVDASLVRDIKPDLLVWATGSVQNMPDIPGLENQHVLTSLEYFSGSKKVIGPRVLVIGAGRTGLEIAEKLGREGYEVTASKRTDPIGSMMEMITRKLVLKRIEEMHNVTLMPHTVIKAFEEKHVDLEQDGVKMSMEPFQTVIAASGMNPAQGPDQEIAQLAPLIETIGDAREVQDIITAMTAGYELAAKY